MRKFKFKYCCWCHALEKTCNVALQSCKTMASITGKRYFKSWSSLFAANFRSISVCFGTCYMGKNLAQKSFGPNIYLKGLSVNAKKCQDSFAVSNRRNFNCIVMSTSFARSHFALICAEVCVNVCLLASYVHCDNSRRVLLIKIIKLIRRI